MDVAVRHLEVPGCYILLACLKIVTSRKFNACKLVSNLMDNEKLKFEMIRLVGLLVLLLATNFVT